MYLQPSFKRPAAFGHSTEAGKAHGRWRCSHSLLFTGTGAGHRASGCSESQVPLRGRRQWKRSRCEVGKAALSGIQTHNGKALHACWWGMALTLTRAVGASAEGCVPPPGVPPPAADRDKRYLKENNIFKGMIIMIRIFMNMNFLESCYVLGPRSITLKPQHNPEGRVSLSCPLCR